ncbi:unnamed protein product [Ilex paraguariensis]|uniref:Cyclic nucleotide-gated ion channel 20, chloroplastic n=1 Tax=Ilex paraguariensis TaxID=185542 RepID=A0ABC8US27_9AQUA
MATFEKDEVPMLSATYSQVDEDEDSQLRRFASRMRSASLTIPMNSMESYENENNLVGHTGPLRNERKTPFIQMSGPLYGRKHENLFRPNQGAIQMTRPTVDKYPSSNGVGPKDWPDNSYAGKNEHLLKSGQLGMCNDPYCTTCPTYSNFKGQQTNSKSSVIFDPKIWILAVSTIDTTPGSFPEIFLMGTQHIAGLSPLTNLRVS